MHFWIIFIIVIALDQVTKLLVQSFMNVGDSVALLGDLFALTYILNPGAAFGFFAYQTTMFIVITVFVIFFIILVNYKLPNYFFMMRTGLAFQLGGAAGNLVDRVRMGYVIDFLDLSFFPPIFNIADLAIVIGIFYFAISLWGEGRQPLAAKKYLPSRYKKVNLRFSPFGYDYKEIEDYLMLISGDIELFNLGREKIEEQLSKRRKELKEIRDDYFEEKDKLQKAVENLRELKERTYRETEEIRAVEEERKKQYIEENETLRQENKDLAHEKKQLLSNRSKYESAVRITENVLSTIYRLADTIPDNARKEAEKTMEDSLKSRQEIMSAHNRVKNDYKAAFEENELLRSILLEKSMKLENNAGREKLLQKALSVSEAAAEKITEEAKLEADNIRKTAEREAAKIIEDTQSRAQIIKEKTVEEDPEAKAVFEKEKDLFKEEIAEMLKNFEEDGFIKDS